VNPNLRLERATSQISVAVETVLLFSWSNLILARNINIIRRAHYVRTTIYCKLSAWAFMHCCDLFIRNGIDCVR